MTGKRRDASRRMQREMVETAQGLYRAGLLSAATFEQITGRVPTRLQLALLETTGDMESADLAEQGATETLASRLLRPKRKSPKPKPLTAASPADPPVGVTTTAAAEPAARARTPRHRQR